MKLIDISFDLIYRLFPVQIERTWRFLYCFLFFFFFCVYMARIWWDISVYAFFRSLGFVPFCLFVVCLFSLCALQYVLFVMLFFFFFFSFCCISRIHKKRLEVIFSGLSKCRRSCCCLMRYLIDRLELVYLFLYKCLSSWAENIKHLRQ